MCIFGRIFTAAIIGQFVRSVPRFVCRPSAAVISGSNNDDNDDDDDDDDTDDRRY